MPQPPQPNPKRWMAILQALLAMFIQVAPMFLTPEDDAPKKDA